MRRLLEQYRIMYSIWRSGLPVSVRKAIRFVGREHLPYLKPVALMDLAAGIEGIEKSNVPGVIIETGCAMGGSSVVIASAKSTNRPFLVFDAFGLIPSPSDEDGQDVHERYNVIKSGKSKGIGGKVYYGYIEDLQETVKGNFAAAGYPVERNAIRLIKGLYQDTLQIAEPVAFAHIDCDWYESVKICLERIVPHLSSGGLLIIDDYNAYSGCKKAVDDFLSENGDMFIVAFKSRLHLQKK